MYYHTHVSKVRLPLISLVHNKGALQVSYALHIGSEYAQSGATPNPSNNSRNQPSFILKVKIG